MSTKKSRGSRPAVSGGEKNAAVAQNLAKAQADAIAKVAANSADAVETAGEAAVPVVEAVAAAPAVVAAQAIDTIEAAAPVAQPAPVIEKAAEAVVTAAEKVAIPVSKDTTMATSFEAPQMVNEFNDRAKASFEKTQKLAAELGDFGKGNIEAIVESSKIAAKGLEALGQDAADYTRRSFEGMTVTVKNLASIKSPTDFFKLQSDYARSAFDAAVAQGSKNTEAMIKLAGDVAQPISNRFAVAVEKVKAVA